MRMHFRSIQIDNCHRITTQTDCNFMFLIQRAVLLGLKEAGRLNEMQHRHADSALLRQFREAIKANTEPSVDD